MSDPDEQIAVDIPNLLKGSPATAEVMALLRDSKITEEEGEALLRTITAASLERIARALEEKVIESIDSV